MKITLTLIYKLKEIYKSLRYGKRIDEIELLVPFIKRYIEQGNQNCFIDVGAHHGGASKFFLDSKWEILAFEPDDKNRKILNDLYSENTNLKIFDYPLSDRIENLKLYTSEISSGLSSLLNFHGTHQEVKNVTTNTLKSVLLENKINKVQFLKIDVEGFDLKVLQGVDFEQCSVDLIMCEYEDFKTKKLGYTFCDTIEFLNSNGYKCILSEWYPIKEYGTRHRWKTFTAEPQKVDKNSWGNIIAIKPKLYNELITYLHAK